MYQEHNLTAWSLQPEDFIETEKAMGCTPTTQFVTDVHQQQKNVRDMDINNTVCHGYTGISRTQSHSPVIAAQRFTETENVPTQRVMKIGQPK